MSEMVLSWPKDSRYPAFIQQPVQNPQLPNDIVIWFEGYIANRAELSAQYGLRRQASEYEILQTLYGRVGVEDTACSLAGTCSWLVWDKGQQKLTLVSDHFGLEPIYFSWSAGHLWVASDSELILRYSGLPRRANPLAIVAQIGGLPIPPGQTLFENISVLPPATFWTYTQGEIRQTQYWQPRMQSTLRLKDDREYAETLRTLLVKVVDEHIPTQGFALTLSSGMDSSSIAGALRLARPKERIPCIGWIMPEFPPINEEEGIRATSSKLELDLTTIQADQYWALKPMELAVQFPHLVFHQEAWIATFQEMNRQGGQTLITGAPGDMYFGNFISSYPDLFISFRWTELFKQIHREIEAGYHKALDWKTPLRLILKPLLLYLKGGRTVPSPRAPVWLHPSKLDLYAQLRQGCRPLRRLGLPARVERWRQINQPGGIQYLARYRKLTNHFGIELRHPLFDHRVLEFALSLPAEQTYHAGLQKYILRNAMRGILPDAITDCRPKILPIRLQHRGLRERSLEQVYELMSNMKLADMGFVLPDELKAAYQLYLDKNTDQSHFFTTLMLESQIRAWT